MTKTRDDKPLTLRQARALAKGRVRAEPSEVDSTLWHIHLHGVYAPMTRTQWLHFLATEEVPAWTDTPLYREIRRSAN